jgi:coproporphyrinogen III oxidase-like Fe-S oxidoreductase
LIDGMNHDVVERLLGNDPKAASRREAIDRHVSTGLLEKSADRLRLSHRGLMLADTVLSDLV